MISEVTETKYITHIDTIAFLDTTRVTIRIKRFDTIPIIVNQMDTSIRTYKLPIVDTLIRGTASIEVDGSLLDFDFKYIPLFPRFIIQTDSIIINTQTLLNTKRTMIGGGLGIGGNEELFKIDISLGIIDKKRNLYRYSFDPINKAHSIGYMRFFSIGK